MAAISTAPPCLRHPWRTLPPICPLITSEKAHIMGLILLIIVIFLLFGGGGYYELSPAIMAAATTAAALA